MRYSVVGRNIVARISWFAWGARLKQLVQLAELGLQQIDLLLLPKDNPIELFEMVFAEAELDLEFGDSGFHTDSPVIKWRRAPHGRPSSTATLVAQHRRDQAKFFAAKSQFAREFRKVSTNFGRAFR